VRFRVHTLHRYQAVQNDKPYDTMLILEWIQPSLTEQSPMSWIVSFVLSQ